MGFRFRASGFGFWVSGLGFRVSGFGFRVSGFGLWVYCMTDAGSVVSTTAIPTLPEKCDSAYENSFISPVTNCEGLSIQDQVLHKKMQRFRGRLVFEAHKLLHHSTLGVRVIKKNKKTVHVSIHIQKLIDVQQTASGTTPGEVCLGVRELLHDTRDQLQEVMHVRKTDCCTRVPRS